MLIAATRSQRSGVTSSGSTPSKTMVASDPSGLTPGRSGAVKRVRSPASRWTCITSLAASVKETLSDVVDGFDPDALKLSLVGGMLTGIPLYGHELVQSWQRRAATYPDQLRVAVVRAHAQIEGLWRLDAFCARGNPVAGYTVLTCAHEELLHALLGLNRVYYSGFKSLEAVAADLLVAPRDLLERMRASYPLRPGASRQILTGLVEDTHDLIEEHLPEIDVDRLRTILRYAR